MKVLTTLATSIALLQGVAAGPLAANYIETRDAVTRIISSAQIQFELGRSLSNSTTILGSSDPAYSNATHRWDTFAVPKVQVVIEVGVESDVSKIVCLFSEPHQDDEIR
jgi:hypothetical protein